MNRAPIRENSIKPTKANIKELLQTARTKNANQKRILQDLMIRDAQTHALLHSQTRLSQDLWAEIGKIRNGIIEPTLQPLKNEFVAILEEGIRTEVIRDLASLARLARLESNELSNFIQLLTKKRNGHSLAFIENLPFFIYKNGIRPEGDICSVCHDEFKEDAECIELECKHIFHRNCISQWLKMKRNCPMCKKQVKKDSNKPRDHNVSDENVRVNTDSEQRIP